MSLSLLNAAGLTPVNVSGVDSLEEEDGLTMEHDSYRVEPEAPEGSGTMRKQIPCPFACRTPLLSDQDLPPHLKPGIDQRLVCQTLETMEWQATTSDLLNNLAQMMGVEAPSPTLSAGPRLDSNGKFLHMTGGLLLARGVALGVHLLPIPQPVGRYMWEWATTDRPDSPAVVNSFQNKLQHQPLVDVLKNMDAHYRPDKFYVPFNKGKHGKSEKNWRPLHEWMLDEFLRAKYIFFRLEHNLRKAGDSIMVVLVTARKVAICFDPKCMVLNGDERAKRDSEIHASVKRFLAVFTKKFSRNVLRDSRRKQWDSYMDLPLAVYVYASPWLEQLIKQPPVDNKECIFELITLAFFYRCTMQETSCYQDGQTDSIPVPTFFLEAVSDIGAMLTDCVDQNGKPKDTFWRELIEWGLSRQVYEAFCNNANLHPAKISELLEQSCKMGRSPDIPARTHVASLEHEFRLVEPIGGDYPIVDEGDDLSSGPAPVVQDDRISYADMSMTNSPGLQKVQSLLKIDMVDDHTAAVNHMVGERALRPVAARKAMVSPVPPIAPFGSSKRKSAVPSKNVTPGVYPPLSPKRRKPGSALPEPSLDGLSDSFSMDSKALLSRPQNGTNGKPRNHYSSGSAFNSFNMPPSLPATGHSSPSSRASAEHRHSSEVLTKLIQPRPASRLDDMFPAYSCLHCHNYQAVDLSLMKDHVREHLGLCPYECYHCHKHFSCLRTFKAHADVLGIAYFKCTVCPFTCDEEMDMHRHIQDEHMELPKCRREDLFGLLKFYKASVDLKTWEDYIGQNVSGKNPPGRGRLDAMMNVNGSKK